MHKLLIFTTLFFFVHNVFGQYVDGNTLLGQANTITTAVPFLSIAPDSRAGALGDAGVATAPDLNSQHWNPAKYSFMNEEMGFSVSYTPWLKGLVNDINLGYVTGYYKFDENQTVSSSLLYFALGDIAFTDDKGNSMGNASPNEFAFDVAYTRKFSQYISGSVSLRYIYSDLTNGLTGEGKPGQTGASDVSTYYQRDIVVSKMPSVLSFGMNISNIGAKISYSDNAEKDFIPINLRLGAGLKMNLDDYNSLFFTADVNKLLVPTQPIYYPIADTTDAEGNQVIQYGKDPNVSVPLGMIQSFYDAPGGATEELREIMYSVGAEYWYDKQFALRAGYFHEHASKGNRKFFTVGFGLKLNVFGLDFAYLIPTQQKHPLENTLRFSLTFDLGGSKSQETQKQL
jgi:hypothetical protein